MLAMFLGGVRIGARVLSALLVAIAGGAAALYYL
jgi:hypothetical protein